MDIQNTQQNTGIHVSIVCEGLPSMNMNTLLERVSGLLRDLIDRRSDLYTSKVGEIRNTITRRRITAETRFSINRTIIKCMRSKPSLSDCFLLVFGALIRNPPTPYAEIAGYFGAHICLLLVPTGEIVYRHVVGGFASNLLPRIRRQRVPLGIRRTRNPQSRTQNPRISSG